MTRRALAATVAAFALTAAGSGCGGSSRYDDLNPEWSGDGRLIAFDRVREGALGDVYVMRRNGSGVRRLAKDVWSWAWSPDGSRLAVDVFDEDAAMLLFDVHGRVLRELPHTTVDSQDPAWSPDGKRLAFVSGGIVERSLVAMDLEIGKVTTLSGEEGASSNPVWPTWSPDGRHVAFVGGIFPERLFVITAGSGERRREIARTRPFESVGPPVWSPDGQTVFFDAGPLGRDVGYLSDRQEIYALGLHGGRLRRVTRNTVLDSVVSVSPNGACLLIKTGPVADPSQEQLYVVRGDGTGRRRLFERAAESLEGVWSPDGRRIATARDRGEGFRIVVEPARGRYEWKLTDDTCKKSSGQS